MILLQKIDHKLRLIERIDQLICNPRGPIFTAHLQRHLLAQRLFAIAFGYEDINDQKALRHNSAMFAANKNDIDEELFLGSPSTLF